MNITDVPFNNGQLNWDAISTISNIASMIRFIFDLLFFQFNIVALFVKN